MKTDFFLEKKVKFVALFDVSKCLEQIKLPIKHHMCASISPLPSNILTMYIIIYLLVKKSPHNYVTVLFKVILNLKGE